MLVQSLLKVRSSLNGLAEQFEWDSEGLDRIAECQAHLWDAFQGARKILQEPKK